MQPVVDGGVGSGRSPLHRREFLRRTARGAAASGLAAAFGSRTVGAAEQRKKPPEMTFQQTPDHLDLTFGPLHLLRYQLRPPAAGGPGVESAAYLHPLSTPGGTVVTDVGPDDHPHHRGVFLSWVEMHGAKDADFWGWGEPAPMEGRRIVNKSVDAPRPELGAARFRAVNEWMADGTRLLTEESRYGVELRDGATMLDYSVRLTPDADLTLARWAFSGFAVRTRKDAEIIPIGAGGRVTLAAPNHMQPASNWPDASWYGLHLKLKDGKEATVVVAGRKANPPTTWHVVAGIGLINPAITAPAAVKLVPAQPLILRYRVLAFDGAPKLPVIQALADAWYQAG